MAVGQDDAPDLGNQQTESAFPIKNMSIMRIAVAGTGGLACIIARCIAEETAHQVVFLSRTFQPQLSAAEYAVAVVDYANVQSLTYALRGVDTIISTVTGLNQIELIKAAVLVGVQRFVAAEFEGLPGLRSPNDPLDRHRLMARQFLASQRIQSTRFVCGVFYERFQPGGLQQSRIGMGIPSGFNGEGDFIIDVRNMSAPRVPAFDTSSNPTVRICMTSARDVGRFVTRALDLASWPSEFKMYGQRVLVKDLIALVQTLTQRRLDPIQWHNSTSLRAQLPIATTQQDFGEIIRLCALISTAEGHYDFSLSDLNRSLNHRFPDIQPMSFRDWFVRMWNLES